jgi:hypothetical protein
MRRLLSAKTGRKNGKNKLSIIQSVSEEEEFSAIDEALKVSIKTKEQIKDEENLSRSQIYPSFDDLTKNSEREVIDSTPKEETKGRKIISEDDDSETEKQSESNGF